MDPRPYTRNAPSLSPCLSLTRSHSLSHSLSLLFAGAGVAAERVDGPHGVRLLLQGANPLSRTPSFVPQGAGFWRPPVQIEGIEKCDLLPLLVWGLELGVQGLGSGFKEERAG